MANRVLSGLDTLSRRSVQLTGRISVNASAAVVSATSRGLGYTAARTGVGVYRITFTDIWPGLVGGSVSLLKSAAGNALFVCVAAVNLTNGVVTSIDLRTENAAAAAADTGSAVEIWFNFSLLNASIANNG